jgi:hypothetical protein
VRGGSGGVRVAAFQAQTMAGCTGSPVTSLSTRGPSDAGGSRGSRPRGITRPGPAGLLQPGCRSTAPRSLAMRHGIRPASHGICQKPRSAGEARASYLLRTTRVGASASPAPLHCPEPRSRMAVGRFGTRLAMPLAFPALARHIPAREVGADVFLANRVRSGRKQPQRDLHGSLPASYFRI